MRKVDCMLLFDRRCPGCGEPHRSVCRGCVDQSELLAPRSVETPDGAAPVLVVPLFRYDDVAARIVLAGKNGGRRDLLTWLGTHLGRRVDDAVSPFDVVTWVPAHPRQRRVRRYDQGRVIAEAVAGEVGGRPRRCLRRFDDASRRGLDRSDRLVGPDIRPARAVRGRVLLIDDVMATGSTIGRCVDALRMAGANEVVAAVVAVSEQGASAGRGSTVTAV